MINHLTSQASSVPVIKPGAVADLPEVLVRARHEILRLLNSILDQDVPLAVSFLHAGLVLSSSVIYVDEASNTLLLACPPDWEKAMGNGDDSIMLSGVIEDSKIEFQGGPSVIVDLEGTPVVGLPIPDFMWRFQRRREPRHKVQGLKIVLNMGFLEAEAEVVDLSTGGIGMLNCHRELKLDNGEILHNCTIVLPGVGQLPVNLAVQNQLEVSLADGKPITRVGCRFNGLTDSARQMIAHFLEAQATA